MIETDIPGFGKLEIKHLVLDYNGILSLDGTLLKGVKDRPVQLAKTIQVHISTADTLGMAASQLEDIPCKLHI